MKGGKKIYGSFTISIRMKGFGLNEIAVPDLMKLALFFSVEETCHLGTGDVLQGREGGGRVRVK